MADRVEVMRGRHGDREPLFGPLPGVRDDVHTNTIEGVWSLLKRSIIGSYHHVSVKHLPAYLDEIEFKYNNRDNPYIFRETLRALVSAETLRYVELVEER